jgi:hypothetical protein
MRCYHERFFRRGFMSDAKICVCPQCGKKFKLKADFAAASFACSGCGATVWVEGKPKGPATTGRKRTAGTRKRSGARSGGGKAAAPAGRGKRRGRQRPQAPVSSEEHHASRQHFGKQDNTQNMIFAVVGLVVVVGALAFFFMGGDKEPPAEPPTKTATGGQDPISDEPPTEAGDENPETTAKTDGGTEETPNGGAEETEDEPAKKETKPLKTTKAKTRIDPKTGRKVRISKWNPPDDIGHLESTPAEQRKEIDELIAMMFDPYAGRDSIDAKPKLALIGKPAYLPILAAMVKAKANFKWDNQHDDNVNMSSVKLADECLRMMDGYLEANGIGVIRPGTDETYYGYVIRMHYKRWKKTLEALDEMPGPFDPSGEYEEETEKVD